MNEDTIRELGFRDVMTKAAAGYLKPLLALGGLGAGGLALANLLKGKKNVSPPVVGGKTETAKKLREQGILP